MFKSHLFLFSKRIFNKLLSISIPFETVVDKDKCDIGNITIQDKGAYFIYNTLATVVQFRFIIWIKYCTNRVYSLFNIVRRKLILSRKISFIL